MAAGRLQRPHLQWRLYEHHPALNGKKGPKHNTAAAAITSYGQCGHQASGGCMLQAEVKYFMVDGWQAN